MNPIYIEKFIIPIRDLNDWIDSLPWLAVTSARKELFMTNPGGVSYTYGEGRGQRTYTSIDMDFIVFNVMNHVNNQLKEIGPMNGCFLNLYENDHNQLGWHSDNFDKMDHSKAVAVVSFGQEREIWWRKIGETGVVPQNQRQLLKTGSLFIMPPGFQFTHEHRIPRGDRSMDKRISLTYRAFL